MTYLNMVAFDGQRTHSVLLVSWRLDIDILSVMSGLTVDEWSLQHIHYPEVNRQIQRDERFTD